MEIKYIGGLKVLLEFYDSVSAREFKDNATNWAHLYEKHRLGDRNRQKVRNNIMDTYCGPTSTTVGEKIFEAITRNFGTTIAPFDEIHHRIGIITHRKNRINDEVYVDIDTEVIKIGVIEFDEDYWFPFQFDPRKSFLEKEFESEKEDTTSHKGVTDDDIEEGEIPPEMVADTQ
ncbi:hypothetical protein LXL04_003616 [Taraxacum kok-saghyz]